MVKFWEINQEFGLEGMPQVPYGAKADLRGWLGAVPFGTAPGLMHMTAGPGIGNGTQVVYDYLTLAWYQAQLVLNDGQGLQTGHNPIDYGYVPGHIRDLYDIDTGLPGSMLLLTWTIKGLQEFTQAGIGPQAGAGTEGAGWDPIDTNVINLVGQGWQPLWSATSPATETSLIQAYLQEWFNQASQYTPQQYYQGGWASATQNPTTISYTESFGGQVWFMLPRLRFMGVSATLTDQISAWAAKIWPVGNWASNNTATCSSLLNCTSGY